jgi:hypothetical protein
MVLAFQEKMNLDPGSKTARMTGRRSAWWRGQGGAGPAKKGHMVLAFQEKMNLDPGPKTARMTGRRRAW